MSLYIFNKFVQVYGRLPTEVDPDYLEMLRMSKYRILDVPDFSPGKCANCGSSKNDGRKYVDFMQPVDWYGTVYLCGLCVHDLADSMGLFNGLRSKMLEARETKQDIENLAELGVRLHETVIKTYKEFEEYYANLHSLRNDSPPDSNPDLGISEAAPESGTSETESRAVKSTPSSRRKNVSSLAELLGKPGIE